MCWLKAIEKITTSLMATMSTARTIEKHVPATMSTKISRLIGTVDIEGKGTNHPLHEVDPFILLDATTVKQHGMPPFGPHPHRGHSVVTILTKGKYSSWDSFSPANQNEADSSRHLISGPASYWVDAGTGVFHDETSVIDDEDDPDQYADLFQLWIGVKEADRHKPPRIQYENNLQSHECRNDDGAVVGHVTYHVGPGANIETPHPIVVAHVRQDPHTVYKMPVDPTFNGFVVHISGQPQIGETEATQKYDVLVLGKGGDYVQVETRSEVGEYLVCLGEPHGEPWAKKLVANGAIFAATAEEARELAPKVEKMSLAGKAGNGFAPFGLAIEK